MTILGSVGKQGQNRKVDGKVIQAALNSIKHVKFKLSPPLKVDGIIGSKTIDVIEDFQKSVVLLTRPDGRVDPGGKTLTTLKGAITKGLSADALLAIMAEGTENNIKKYQALFGAAFVKYSINSPLRKAHFLAQIGHESLSFNYTEEIASGAAYEGRKDLGNTHKGDGVRFKGRGLIQLTGRSNYAEYGKYIGIDLLQSGNERTVSKTPKYALDVSMWFWQKRHLNTYADQDNIKAITRRINGGYNGLADRQHYLDRAKFFLLP